MCQIFKNEWHLFILCPTKWQCYNHTLIKASLSPILRSQRHIFIQFYFPDPQRLYCSASFIRHNPYYVQHSCLKQKYLRNESKIGLKGVLNSGLYSSLVDELLSELPHLLISRCDFIFTQKTRDVEKPGKTSIFGCYIDLTLDLARSLNLLPLPQLASFFTLLFHCHFWL